MICTVRAGGRLVGWNSTFLSKRPPTYEEDEMCLMNTLLSLEDDLENQKKQAKQKSGCYIATACYGNYDCTQVLTFRNFRDKYLSQSIAGRMFINVYYALSPSIAKWLENKHNINTFIRNKVLEPMYNFLKNKY